MPIRFAGFDWDEGNRHKCAKHGVSQAEIEQVFQGDPAVVADAAHSGAERRFLAVGYSTAGRHIFVAFTIRLHGQDQLIRPISARYMHGKEVAYYETHSDV